MSWKTSSDVAYHNRKLHQGRKLESRLDKTKNKQKNPLSVFLLYFLSQSIISTGLFCDIANSGSKEKLTKKSKWKFSISKKIMQFTKRYTLTRTWAVGNTSRPMSEPPPTLYLGHFKKNYIAVILVNDIMQFQAHNMITLHVCILSMLTSQVQFPFVAVSPLTQFALHHPSEPPDNRHSVVHTYEFVFVLLA